MREKFTTTLNPDHKKKLAVLSANNSMDRNEWIEMMIDIEWGKYVNEMGSKNNRKQPTK